MTKGNKMAKIEHRGNSYLVLHGRTGKVLHQFADKRKAVAEVERMNARNTKRKTKKEKHNG